MKLSEFNKLSLREQEKILIQARLKAIIMLDKIDKHLASVRGKISSK